MELKVCVGHSTPTPATTSLELQRLHARRATPGLILFGQDFTSSERNSPLPASRMPGCALMAFVSISRTLDSVVPLENRSRYRMTAIFGDLQHKLDLYTRYQAYGPAVEAFFTNQHQACFLREHFPSLVPPPAQPGQPPSDHTLGTVFEFHYHSDLDFRFTYLRLLPDLPSGLVFTRV